MTINVRLLALASLVAAAEVACREAAVAPVAPLVPATLALDTVSFGNSSFAQANMWKGLTTLVAPDQSVQVLALDTWNGRLRYHRCLTMCTDASHWIDGTADTGFTRSWYPAGNAVLTADGIHATYDNAGQSIRYLHCAGACDVIASWTATNLLVGRGHVGGRQDGHSTPLAADRAGHLHLVFYDSQDSSLSYAYCAAGCDNPTGWQEVPIDSTYASSSNTRLIAVAPDGGLHVLYGAASGLTHASCTGRCTIAGSWRSEIVPADTSLAPYRAQVAPLSLAFGPDGRLHLAYLYMGLWRTMYATCAAPCSPPAAWSTVTLPISANDLSLAADGHGQLYLATTGRTVAVTRCIASCLNPASWQTVTADSALGYGGVSIAVDAAGSPRIASSYGGFPPILQYTELRQ